MSMLAEWAPAGDASVLGGLLQQIENGYAGDVWFADEKHTAALAFSDGVWHRGSQIGFAEDVRQKCLSLHHGTPFAGHSGRDRTMQLVLQTYWWPGLDRDVQQYVSSCDHWQRNKASHEKPAGLLQPLPVPEFRWQWVTVDFITDLPETKAGLMAIVVFMPTE